MVGPSRKKVKVPVSPGHEANGSVALMVTTGTLVVCAKMLFALVPKDNRREMAKKVRGKRGAKCLIVFIRLRRSVTARAVTLNPATILKEKSIKSRASYISIYFNLFRICPDRGGSSVQSAALSDPSEKRWTHRNPSRRDR